MATCDREKRLREALLSRDWIGALGVVAESSERIPRAGAFGAAISLSRHLIDVIAEASAAPQAGEYLRKIGCTPVDWPARVEERMKALRRMEGSAGHRGLPRGYFEWCLSVADDVKAPRAAPTVRHAPPARARAAFSPPPRALWRQRRLGPSPLPQRSFHVDHSRLWGGNGVFLPP